MMRPVGVGRMSRGPIGVDGLTMTAGSASSAIIASTRCCAATLLRLYAPIAPGLGERRRLVGRLSVRAQRQRGDTARVDDALNTGAQRGFHDRPRAGDVVAPDLVAVGDHSR